MDFNLADEQKLIQETDQEFAGKEIRPVTEGGGVVAKWPTAVNKESQRLGLTNVYAPERYGGPGLGDLETS